MFNPSRRRFFCRAAAAAAAAGLVATAPAAANTLMIKCPFCGFENEDGALFCEQCKSDLCCIPPPPPPPPPIPRGGVG
jgi:hypothetical protein